MGLHEDLNLRGSSILSENQSKALVEAMIKMAVKRRSRKPYK